MAATYVGPLNVGLTRDATGYRTYDADYLVETDGAADGPLTAMLAPGLPLPGSYWVFGSEADQWAYCTAEGSATEYEKKPGAPGKFWKVSRKFTNKPLPPNQQRCQDTPVDNPLLEPPKVSGPFARFHEELTKDRFDEDILYSTFEPIRGKAVEFEFLRPGVKVDMNVAKLDLAVLAYFAANPLNAQTLWGMPPRTVKLSSLSWERRYYGTCSTYYALSMEFETNSKGFDRDVLDESNKVLSGKWGGTADDPEWVLVPVKGRDPDPENPTHFIRAVDRQGAYTRLVLNGAGVPADVTLRGDGKFIALVEAVPEHDLGDIDVWAEVVGEAVPIGWDPTVQYSRGNLTSWGGNTYIALLPTIGDDPELPESSDWWKFVCNNDPNDTGELDPDVTYAPGDIVDDPDLETAAGRIRVEGYGESNLLLLGIPATL